jgi:hypothetical protein
MSNCSCQDAQPCNDSSLWNAFARASTPTSQCSDCRSIDTGPQPPHEPGARLRIDNFSQRPMSMPEPSPPPSSTEYVAPLLPMPAPVHAPDPPSPIHPVPSTVSSGYTMHSQLCPPDPPRNMEYYSTVSTSTAYDPESQLPKQQEPRDRAPVNSPYYPSSRNRHQSGSSCCIIC